MNQIFSQSGINVRRIMVVVFAIMCMTQSILAQGAQQAMPDADEHYREARVFAKTSLVELGVTLPLRPSVITDYIKAHGISTIPFTSGYGTGALIGRHAIISRQTTIGVIAHANFFSGSDSASNTSQIAELSALLTARIILIGDSWRGGLYMQLGAGVEMSVAKFAQSSAVYQVNIASRAGVGYNIKLGDDVTVGVAILAVPSLSDKNIIDGSVVAFNMLW